MRKLASLQTVAEVRPIEGADRIVSYRINDWWVVDQKDRYNVGDMVVYFEIDSILPITPTFEFLASRGKTKSELEDGTIVEGYRLKTIRLKGQYSQGLIMPWGVFGDALFRYEDTVGTDGRVIQRQHPDTIGMRTPDGVTFVGVGEDVTELLGVHKYEKPMNTQLRGMARGNFPSFLRKSDQERCQNLRREIWDAYVADDAFEVTVKLDGSSMTAFYITPKGAEAHFTESRFGVCSRNLEILGCVPLKID